MNKSYFAKYLPVEGSKPSQIPVGKNVPVMKNNKLQFMQIETADKMHKFMQFDGYRKGIYLPAKLFLCSRDINFGDEVFGSDTPNIKFIWDEWGKKGAELANSLHLYMKVIGEISPEAIWVKDGDEFDENEIIMYYPKKYNKTPFDNGIIKIKCSQCNKFH